jgi:hypothetical protein
VIIFNRECGEMYTTGGVAIAQPPDHLNITIMNDEGKNKKETSQEYYENRLREMSGTEKTTRSLTLFKMMYETLANQISKAEPELTERQVRIKVFRRFYASDKNAQELLDIAWNESLNE